MAARAEVYKRKDGKTWGWRLISANERIIATDGSQGYVDKTTAETMCKRVIGGEWKAVPIKEVDLGKAEQARLAAKAAVDLAKKVK